MSKKLDRLAYLSGPVDAVKVYETWAAGGQHGYFGTSYLSQFYELCTELDAEGYVITTLPGKFSRRSIGKFVIENRPTPANAKGTLFHLATGFWMLRLLPNLIRCKAQVFVITALQNYWFFLLPLRCTRTMMVAAIHGALWPKFQPVRRSWKILLWLNSWLLAGSNGAVIAASKAIAEQLRQLVGRRDFDVKIFLPTYARGQFDKIQSANFNARPFNILFAGRIEVSKGVFDLVKMAQSLERQERGQVHFDVCGDGSQLDALRRHIDTLGLANVISCHGYCEREVLLSFFQRAHAVIVPTTSELEEGFNMVCAEAVLANRPVITSAVCPALDYVWEAAVEVPSDDIPAYCRAILDLANERALYEQKTAACKRLQQQFYDVNSSWGAKLRQVLARHFPSDNFRPGMNT